MMKKKRVYQIILIFIVLIFTLSEIPVGLPAGGVDPVQAGPFGPNLVLGFIRSLEAINQRNRVYREAGITSKEINAYYDTLLENSKIAYDEMNQQSKKGEIPSAFAASYQRIEAGLEAERAAAIQMIEAEKKGARASFKKTIKKQIFSMLLASPGAQKLLKDIRETIDGVRQAANTIKDALSAKLPTKTLINQFSDRFGKIPWLKATVHQLGSKIGQKLNQKMGGIFTRLEKPTDMVISELDDALKKIDELDRDMAKLQTQAVTPYSLREIAGDLSGFRALDRSQAGADAISYAYINRAQDLGLLDDSDEAKKQMRDRIRAVLQETRISNLWEKAKTATAFATCLPSKREEYIKAMEELGLTPEEPLDPTQVGYIVCYAYPTEIDENTKRGLFGSIEHVIIYAALIGPSKADAEAQISPEENDQDTEDQILTISVSSEKPETIEDLWAHEVAFRIEGDCPAVDANYEWALPDEKPCKLLWDVYYDIDSLALDLRFSDDPANAWAEIDLTGTLLLKEIFGVGEMGYGTISAKGQLQNLTMIESTPGSIQLEGKVPINLTCQGEYLILHTSDGYNVLNDGGVDTTIEALIKVDVSQRRLEIRYEEFPLGIPTGVGDGNLIEALRLDVALFWAEGQLKK